MFDKRDEFILGDSNGICDVCGWKMKQSQLRKRWDGAMVCDKDFEHRHPQDSLKAIPEKNNIRDARPQPEPRFLQPGEVTADDL